MAPPNTTCIYMQAGPKANTHVSMWARMPLHTVLVHSVHLAITQFTTVNSDSKLSQIFLIINIAEIKNNSVIIVFSFIINIFNII